MGLITGSKLNELKAVSDVMFPRKHSAPAWCESDAGHDQVKEIPRMKRAIPILFGGVLLALSGTLLAQDQSCAVPGLTTRWALSFCMTRSETDDEAHPEVSECFVKELQQRTSDSADEDCAANLVYKAAICSLAIEYERYEDSLASCVDSDDMIPSVVTHGIP